MKKVVFITGIYTAIIFALCLLISVFFIPCPESLIAGTEKPFVFYYGLYIFLVCLPGILSSIFLFGSGIRYFFSSSNTSLTILLCACDFSFPHSSLNFPFCLH